MPTEITLMLDCTRVCCWNYSNPGILATSLNATQKPSITLPLVLLRNLEKRGFLYQFKPWCCSTGFSSWNNSPEIVISALQSVLKCNISFKKTLVFQRNKYHIKYINQCKGNAVFKKRFTASWNWGGLCLYLYQSTYMHMYKATDKHKVIFMYI